ncbi:uncharacterized protein [Primulina eburnea]|uniref:uncharacterized protein n=1 Tax=Primulina eburnea TaxID=1245227 RepID=UPI003C6C1AA9
MKDVLTQQGSDYRPPKRARENPDPGDRRRRSQPRNEQYPPPEQNQPEPNRQPRPPPRGIINMISGGPTDGDSNRARKTSSRRLTNTEITEVKTRTGPLISFGPEDLVGLTDPHNDALVIRATIANYEVARIFVDSGSSVNVLFQEAMDQMDLGEYKVEPVSTPLFGFTGHAVQPIGMINMSLTLGDAGTRKTRIISFIIVNAPSAYNAILG